MKSAFLIPAAAAGMLLLPAAHANHWPAWRGPFANGTAREGCDPPLQWSESENVRWKVAVPGRGTSTPVIWDDRIFLTTAIEVDAPTSGEAAKPAADATPEAPPAREEGRGRRRGRGFGGFGGGGAPAENLKVQRFVVLCLDRATGKTLWQQTAAETRPHEGHHQDHGFASHSPVTDGKHVYAYFGSRGLHCYDLDGNRKWSKEFGQMRTRNSFGEGSSPLLVGDVVIVNWDHEGEDFIVALNKIDGTELWRRDRDEPTTWATPVAAVREGGTQVVVNGTNRIRSYDLATGRELWSCGGMTTNAIPSPVIHRDAALVVTGFRGSAGVAVRLDAVGDVTDTDAVLWKHSSNTPYVPSPLLSNGRIWFFQGNTGILSALNADDGTVLVDAQRISGFSGVYASPVAASGRIYLTGRNGKFVVIRDAEKFEILAESSLDEKFDASPAVAGNELFLRGHNHLYCIAKP